jgi:hypothetical protein
MTETTYSSTQLRILARAVETARTISEEIESRVREMRKKKPAGPTRRELRLQRRVMLVRKEFARRGAGGHDI